MFPMWKTLFALLSTPVGSQSCDWRLPSGTGVLVGIGVTVSAGVNVDVRHL